MPLLMLMRLAQSSAMAVPVPQAAAESSAAAARSNSSSTAWVVIRITSYNVCYTKLLRISFSMVTFTVRLIISLMIRNNFV